MSKVQKIKFAFSSSKFYRYRVHYWFLKIISGIISYFLAGFVKNKLVVSEEGRIFGWLDVIKHHPDKWVPAIAIAAGLFIFLLLSSLINCLDKWLTFSFNYNQLLEIIKQKKINLLGEDFAVNIEEISFNSKGKRPIISARGILSLKSDKAISNLGKSKNIRLYFSSSLPISFLTNRYDDLNDTFPQANIKLKERKVFLSYYYLPFIFIIKVLFCVVAGASFYLTAKNLKGKNWNEYLKDQAKKVDTKKWEFEQRKIEAEKKRLEEESKKMFRPNSPEEIKVSFEDVGGYEQVKDRLRLLVGLLKSGEPLTRGILLYGPPGTGKTLLAKATAKEVGLAYYSAKGLDFRPSFKEEQEMANYTQGKLEAFFGEASAYAREKKLPGIVVLIDEIPEMDGIFDPAIGLGERCRGLLPILDGLERKYDNIFFIATTNHPNILGEAVTRSGRLEEQYEIGEPKEKELEKIISLQLKKFAKEKSQKVNNCSPSRFASRFQNFLVNLLKKEGMVGADIERLIFRNAPAVKVALGENHGSASDIAQFGFTEKIFKTAIEQIKGARFNRFKEWAKWEKKRDREKKIAEEEISQLEEEKEEKKPSN